MSVNVSMTSPAICAEDPTEASHWSTEPVSERRVSGPTNVSDTHRELQPLREISSLEPVETLVNVGTGIPERCDIQLS